MSKLIRPAETATLRFETVSLEFRIGKCEEYAKIIELIKLPRWSTSSPHTAKTIETNEIMPGSPSVEATQPFDRKFDSLSKSATTVRQPRS